MTDLRQNLPRACALLALGGLTLAAADQRVAGQTATFGGAPVSTWATLDAQGAVTQVGFTLPYAAVENAPAMAGMNMAHPEIVVLNVPPAVRDTTFVDHIELDWMPQGHEPARYQTPHFDFHFYGVDGGAPAAVGFAKVSAPGPSVLPAVRPLAVSAFYSLAVGAGGKVVAWGGNVPGKTNVPRGLAGAVAVAAGHDHSLALRGNGTVVAWGYNDYGQTNVPGGLSGVVAIAAGPDYSLALKNDGMVIAWGSNAVGQASVPDGLRALRP